MTWSGGHTGSAGAWAALASGRRMRTVTHPMRFGAGKSSAGLSPTYTAGPVKPISSRTFSNGAGLGLIDSGPRSYVYTMDRK